MFRVLMTLVFVSVTASVFWTYREFQRSVTTEPLTLEIAEGATPLKVLARFERNPWDPYLVRIALRLSAPLKLHKGEFEIPSGLNWLQLISHLRGAKPKLYFLTHKEGHNVFDLHQSLKETPLSVPPESWQKLIRRADWLKRMNVPTSGSGTLEGFLFPNTYAYQKFDRIETLFESMLGEFERQALPRLKTHSWAREPNGIYRLLTLASIVEKESGHADEQPRVAAVFWNRLKKRMKLQSDPTTIYGLLPLFDGNIRKIHLTTPTPYNTYTLKELPLGPISNPGLTAIEATLNPADTDDLFFVADAQGRHVFSQTYAEHKKWVEEYQIKPARERRMGR
jgi:UPF0755 protein